MTPIDDIVLVSPVLGTTAIELLDPRSCLRGKVIAVGPGRVTSEGVRIEPEVKTGDMVRLAPARSVEAIFDQRRVWVTREREILAVEIGEPPSTERFQMITNHAMAEYD